MYCKPITLSPADITHIEPLIQKNSEAECWPFLGGRNKLGYGVVFFHGRHNGYLAHRVAYTIANGPIGNFILCHSCDNPICCNPAHLIPGTHADNKLDSVHKQRHAHAETAGIKTHPERYPKGSQLSKARLNESQVTEIRRLYAAGGRTHRSLAEQFGVGKTTIESAIKRIWWKHVV